MYVFFFLDHLLALGWGGHVFVFVVVFGISGGGEGAIVGEGVVLAGCTVGFGFAWSRAVGASALGRGLDTAGAGAVSGVASAGFFADLLEVLL